MDKKKVFLFYHYKQGKITNNSKTFETEDLLDTTRTGDNDEAQETPQSQILKEIYNRQSECHETIKEAEKQMMDEESTRFENIHLIQQCMQ